MKSATVVVFPDQMLVSMDDNTRQAEEMVLSRHPRVWLDISMEGQMFLCFCF